MENNQKNDINELREILFSTIRGVSSGKVKPDTARSVIDLSQMVIETAKVEILFLKETENKNGTGFFDKPSTIPPDPAGGYQHKMGISKKIPLENKQ